MKRKLTAGLTGVTLPIFVADTSSTTGGGLSGLVFNTGGLVFEYRRQGQAAWTAIPLAAGTLGTWATHTTNTGGTIIADGAVAKAGTWTDASADAAGTATWFRFRTTGDAGTTNTTDKRLDGLVTATGGGGDLVLDNAVIAAAQSVTISSFTFTMPAA